MARELTPEQQQTHDLLTGFVQPWHDAVANPQAAQDEVLRGLLDGYARTRYGREHGAGSITTLEQYRERFPVVTYEDLKPLIQRTMAGETELLLYEEPAGWAITRGTTRGESKFIPMIPTYIMMRVAAGRAVMQYTLRSGEYDVFDQYNLNLNFPSVVGTVRMGSRDVEYGYSSGIYVKHVSRWTPLRSLPTQEDIDALGGGKTIADWERRFELAYQRCCSQPVSVLGGVAPTAVAFARYLKKAHGVLPRDLWKVRVMTLGSVPGINTRYVPALRAMYGQVTVMEIYGATEGMFGQQRDERRAWVPNYDLFFFEVATSRGLRQLHEMRPGETGRLIVSTPILPRYRIGDLIMAFDSPYFRCIGREGRWTRLQYYWDQLSRLDFGPV